MHFRYKPDIFTGIPGIKHYLPQAIPVVLKLCRLAGIASAVNRMAHWNESNSVISPGLVIESLVTCIMCNRKPLWRVHEFWARQDLAMLFPGVEFSSGKLNDDACGRALDKLAEIDRQSLISTCCLTMLQEHELDILATHFDTTSISVQGAYDDEPYGDFDICYGHSKDMRPDLKQFMIGASVQQDGLPIIDSKRIADRAGHSTTKTTEDIYLHVLPDHQDAIALLLEELFFRATDRATEDGLA